MILSSLWGELHGQTYVKELWVSVLVVQKSSTKFLNVGAWQVLCVTKSPLNDSVAVPANSKHESRQKEQLI